MMAMDPLPEYAPLSLDEGAAEEAGAKKQLHEHDDREPASWAWIYTLGIANFGISGAWALYVAKT